MSKTKPARKAHPLVIAIIAVVILLLIYVGAYYANRTGKRVVVQYVSPDGALVDIYLGTRYRIAQDTSERLFWPLDLIDGKLRPHRYE